MKNSRRLLISALIILLSLITCAFGSVFADGQVIGVSIDSIAYKDAENNQVRISVSFDNPDYDGTGTIICLLYNSVGECEDVINEPVLDFSKTKHVFVSSGFDKVRVFLWESMKTLKPLGKEKALSFSDITKKLTEVTFDTSEADEICETLPHGDMVFGTKFVLPSKDSLVKNGYVLTGFKVNGVVKDFGDEITVGEEEVVIIPVFVKLSSYTVEYYHQNITDDNYTLTDSYTIGDKIVGATVNATIKSYDGFHHNSDISNVTGEVLSDNALVLKVYYDRNIITVSFDENGGNEVSDKSGKYESEITLPTDAEVSKLSHILTGWEDENGEIHPAGSKVTLTENATYTACWIELSGYTVEYYQQNIEDDGYTKADSYSVGDTEVGTTVNATTKTFTGFTYNPTISNATGEVLSDNALVLKVYYDRVLVKVTFDTSDVDKVNETLPQGDMKYGAKFALPAKDSLTKSGYILKGFTVNGDLKTFGDEITVGQDEINVAPVFEKLISYKIEYYRENSSLDGYTLYKTDSSKTALEGTTVFVDTENVPKYSGYYFDSENSLNILSATQTSEGAVLKVYYKRLVVTVEYYRHNPYVTDYYLYQTKTVPGGYENAVFGVENLTLPDYPNYVYNSNAPESVLSGTVTKDGLTLKIYYDLVIDETAQSQVIFRINRILTDLNNIQFTTKERKVLSKIIPTMNQTLADAENGAYIYMEGYVREYYGSEVDIARAEAEKLKETGEFTAFKSKLGQLRGNDVEYLAKAMFGIDDIEKWV